MAQTPPSNIAQALQRIDMIRTNMETASRQLNLDNLKKLVDDAEQTKSELSTNLNNLFSNIHGLSAQDLNQSIQSITDLETRLGNTINAINTLIPFGQGGPSAGQTGPGDDSGSGDGGMGQQWPVAPTETPVIENKGANAPSDKQPVPVAEELVGGYNWRSKRKSRRNKRSSKKSTTKKSTRKHKKSKNKSKSR